MYLRLGNHAFRAANVRMGNLGTLMFSGVQVDRQIPRHGSQTHVLGTSTMCCAIYSETAAITLLPPSSGFEHDAEH